MYTYVCVLMQLYAYMCAYIYVCVYVSALAAPIHMCACMCGLTYSCVACFVHVCVLQQNIWIHMYLCMYMYVYVYIDVYVRVWIYVCRRWYVYVCMYMRALVCICVCLYICMRYVCECVLHPTYRYYIYMYAFRVWMCAPPIGIMSAKHDSFMTMCNMPHTWVLHIYICKYASIAWLLLSGSLKL